MSIRTPSRSSEERVRGIGASVNSFGPSSLRFFAHGIYRIAPITTTYCNSRMDTTRMDTTSKMRYYDNLGSTPLCVRRCTPDNADPVFLDGVEFSYADPHAERAKRTSRSVRDFRKASTSVPIPPHIPPSTSASAASRREGGHRIRCEYTVNARPRFRKRERAHRADTGRKIEAHTVGVSGPAFAISARSRSYRAADWTCIRHRARGCEHARDAHRAGFATLCTHARSRRREYARAEDAQIGGDGRLSGEESCLERRGAAASLPCHSSSALVTIFNAPLFSSNHTAHTTVSRNFPASDYDALGDSVRLDPRRAHDAGPTTSMRSVLLCAARRYQLCQRRKCDFVCSRSQSPLLFSLDFSHKESDLSRFETGQSIASATRAYSSTRFARTRRRTWRAGAVKFTGQDKGRDGDDVRGGGGVDND
ncbi:hypothetical protein B0H11DRAFT_1912606 [Mycena galericulata]|nr:hypothetical protein B0H11DRAFT_1912606 [Mycena galericulata]